MIKYFSELNLSSPSVVMTPINITKFFLGNNKLFGLRNRVTNISCGGEYTFLVIGIT